MQKGFVSKFVPSISCTRVLSNRALCGALPNPPRAHLSTTTQSRLSTKYASQRAINADWHIPTTTFPREITWLAGAPGAGKGTNSSFIANTHGYNAPTIVMSSLLEGPECKRIKDAGGMVDDETVQRALLEELAKPEYREGVVVDGFPRTEKQAQWLCSLYDTVASSSPLNFNFIMLYIEEEASVARQLARGEAIRKLNSVRSANGLPPLEERATDVSEDAARVRYYNFVQQYEAVNKLRERFPLAVVDAFAPIETVRQRLLNTLKTKSSSPSPSTATHTLSQRQFANSLNMPVLSSMKPQARSYAYL